MAKTTQQAEDPKQATLLAGGYLASACTDIMRALNVDGKKYPKSLQAYVNNALNHLVSARWHLQSAQNTLLLPEDDSLDPIAADFDKGPYKND